MALRSLVTQEEHDSVTREKRDAMAAGFSGENLKMAKMRRTVSQFCAPELLSHEKPACHRRGRRVRPDNAELRLA
jgi:hypothetical protein